MSSPPPIDHVELETAADLLDVLGRRHPDWGSAPNNWIFRGQGNAAWKLKPSALRDRVRGYRLNASSSGPRESAREQVKFEMDMLRMFTNTVNEEGGYIPSNADDYVLRLYRGDPLDVEGRELLTRDENGTTTMEDPWREEQIHNWPARDVWEYLAIAQHNGVPTRLLDWTYDPKIAAYFAAKTAAGWIAKPKSRPDDAEQLAVWCLSRGGVGSLWMSLGGAHILIIQPSANGNDNMRAQRGVFTVIRCVKERNYPHDLFLDLHVERLSGSPFEVKDEDAEDAGPVLRKLTLPLEEAPRLLRLLEEEFVSAASMFPGYGGAVRALEEQRLWDMSRRSE